MQVFLECIPCFLKQAVQAVKLATPKKDIQEKALKESLKILHELNWSSPPPFVAREIHNTIKVITKNPDPYAVLKQKSNKIALSLSKEFEKILLEEPNAFEIALKLSLAGNMIDFGARPGEDIDIKNEIENMLKITLNQKEVKFFKEKVYSAKKILFLGDNAGELVFDKFLIKQIGPEKITYVIKATPIINDATMEDAKITGLIELVRVIDNGGDYPGTVLENCSKEFLEEFETADLIISKGQGNFETLMEVEKPIFFLFKVKCSVVSQIIQKPVGSSVIYFKNA